MKIRVLAKFNPLRNWSKRVSRRARNLRPAMSGLKREFVHEQKRHFKDQEGPDGKWPERAPSTLGRSIASRNRALRAKGSKRRARSARKPLGKLRYFRTKISKNEITAESPVRWSGAHQDGARVGRGSRLPERTFLWVSSAWLRRHARPRMVRYMLRGKR